MRICAEITPPEPRAAELPPSHLGDTKLRQSSGFWIRVRPPGTASCSAVWSHQVHPSQPGVVLASQPPPQPKTVELPPSQPGAFDLTSAPRQFRPGLEKSSSPSHPGTSLKSLDPGIAYDHLELRHDRSLEQLSSLCPSLKSPSSLHPSQEPPISLRLRLEPRSSLHSSLESSSSIHLSTDLPNSFSLLDPGIVSDHLELLTFDTCSAV